MPERGPSLVSPDSGLPERSDEVLFESVSEIAAARLDQARTVETPIGTIVYGADEGLGRKSNQDAVVVNTDRLAVAVIDGNGSAEIEIEIQGTRTKVRAGDVATRVVAEELRDMFVSGALEPEDFEDLHNVSRERMAEGGAQEGGACYLAAWITAGKLQGFWAGDVQLAIYDSSGRMKYLSEPDREADGRTINNAIFGSDEYISSGPKRLGPIDVAAGDRIIVASDGVSDNFPFAELGAALHGLSAEAAMRKLANDLPDRMDAPGGKPDNRAAVIFDLKATAVAA